MSTTLQTIALTTVKAEARVDTRQLALQLGNKHQNTFELLKQYQPDFESFGKVLFETGASTDSKTGQSERYALLNEDQAYRGRLERLAGYRGRFGGLLRCGQHGQGGRRPARC